MEQYVFETTKTFGFYCFMDDKHWVSIPEYGYIEYYSDFMVGLNRNSSSASNTPWPGDHIHVITAMLGNYSNRAKFGSLRRTCRTELSPGSYFPRMNRDCPKLHDNLGKTPAMLDEVRAYLNIAKAMEDVFNSIEPHAKNFETFGHRIREVIMLACTEVEYLLAQALKENGYTSPLRDRMNTTDYIHLLAPLSLDKYQMQLKMHENVSPISPFFGWNVECPTRSLHWYSAYNSVKHDRGGKREEGTFKVMIDSVAAIQVLLTAQYGQELFDVARLDSFLTPFNLVGRPKISIENFTPPLFVSSEESETTVNRPHVKWVNPIPFFNGIISD